MTTPSLGIVSVRACMQTCDGNATAKTIGELNDAADRPDMKTTDSTVIATWLDLKTARIFRKGTVFGYRVLKGYRVVTFTNDDPQKVAEPVPARRANAEAAINADRSRRSLSLQCHGTGSSSTPN
jgi:hypothetical protein